MLRSHPGWSFHELLEYVDSGRPGSAWLGDMTLAELLAEPQLPRLALPSDRGPMIDLERRAEAERASGAAFDRFVHETLREADGEAVAACYLRARVGGPRWKLLRSLRLLVDVGKATKTGTTSTARYRARMEES